ncbi:hypothetical protein DFQ29_002825 [Apophysomyces sp. BC1021]|nr:hypothetical protein DFQ29_002825 [Apophysomyces sp. BC1021]
MGFSFYFEDGLGNVIDENGNDPTDVTESEDPFKLEELSSYSTYVALIAKLEDRELMQEYQVEKQENNNEIKAHTVHLVDVHLRNSARAVALELKLEPRTAAQELLSSKENQQRQPKSLVPDFYFKFPTATMDQMTNNFEDPSISRRALYRYMADLWIFTLKRVQLEPVERSTPQKIQIRKEWVEKAKELDIDYMHNSIAIDESGFNANLRRSQGWVPKGEAAKANVPTARANSISILGATSAKGLIKISLRKLIPPSKKRKLAGDKKQQTKGTQSPITM